MRDLAKNAKATPSKRKKKGKKFNGEAAEEEEMIIFDRSGKLLESLR